MIRTLLAMMIFLLAWGTAWSEDLTPEQKTIQELGLPPMVMPSGTVLTLEEAFSRAWESHPALASKRAIVGQNVAKLAQVYALYLPTVGIATQQIFQFNSLEALLPREGTTYVGIQQTLFDFGQRNAQARAATESLLSSRIDLQSAWVDQVETIREAYYKVLLTSMLLVVAQDDLVRNQQSLKYAEGLLKAGTKSMIDVTQAKFQVTQAQGSLASAQNNMLDAQISLAQAIGIEATEVQQRALVDELLEIPHLVAIEQAESQMDTSHPDLLSLEAQRRSALATRRYNALLNMPSATGVATYGRFGNYPPPTPSTIGVYSVTLTLSFPFYTPTVVPLMQQFEALAEQLRKDRENRRLQLAQALRTAYADVAGAEQRVVVAIDENKVAVENYRLASRRYETGLGPFTDLVNARGFLLTARRDISNALYDRKVAEAKALQAMGSAAPLPGETAPETLPGTTPVPTPSPAPTPSPSPSPTPEASPSPVPDDEP